MVNPIKLHGVLTVEKRDNNTVAIIKKANCNIVFEQYNEGSSDLAVPDALKPFINKIVEVVISQQAGTVRQAL